MRSMTGYGHAERHHGAWRLSVELTAVNRKQADVALFLPGSLSVLESDLRKRIVSRISRGRVQARINVEREGEDSDQVLHFDEGLAHQYLEALERLAETDGRRLEVRTLDLLRAPGVFSLEEGTLSPEDLQVPVAETIDQALDALEGMQATEGAHLRQDLESRVDALERLTATMAQAAPGVVRHYREALHQRLQQSGLEIDLGDERLVREIALFAERCDISEEITRIGSHLQQFRSYLESEQPCGRPLDFLCQELNREFNTIGSKANDAELAQWVVDAKSELEKAREQVQNVQ